MTRTGDRSSLLTVATIAIVAYAACDMVHEVLGHGTAVLFSDQVRAVLLTTVALSSKGSSRLVSAAGTIANLFAGLLALRFVGSGRGAGSARYFLWLFGSLNLLNATGYPLYSGILESGDWAAVTAGLQPHVAWRVALVVVGIAGYVVSVKLSTAALRRLVGCAWLGADEVRRVVVAPYWIGGMLLVAGAALNPISPSLILSAGIASGFGAMVGLFWVAGIMAIPESEPNAATLGLAGSRGWAIAALVVAVVFIFVIGPGIPGFSAR